MHHTPPSVVVSLGSAQTEMKHGDFIGRLQSSRLRIDDPRISEAHALISLRRGHLHILSLRRRFVVGGKPMSALRLRLGMRVELAPGIEFLVKSVTRPSKVAVLATEDGQTRLLAPVTSLYGRDSLRLADHYREDADAHVWQAADGEWLWRLADVDEPCPVGNGFELAGKWYDFRFVSAEQASQNSTVGASAGEALRIVTRYDVVEFHIPGHPVTTISGLGARLISELATYCAPIEWGAVADALWPALATRGEKRRRWDIALSRLRRKLTQLGVRSNLIYADGTGLVQLLLATHDSVEDCS